MAVPVEHHHGMTVAEFERYATGHPDDRLELIDGDVHTESPLSVLHLAAVLRTHEHLRARYPDAIVIAGGGSVRLDDSSLWEPDLFVIDQLPDDQYIDAADIVHIVEVAVSSWNKDTGPKLTGYARNGIPEYWVIDPKPGGAFHRFSEPHLGGYRQVVTTELPDGITSLPF